MTTRKTSVALGAEELAAAKKVAAAEGTSVSAFLTKLVRDHVTQQARFDAMASFLAEHAPGFRLTAKAAAAVEAEWTSPLAPVRRRRRKRSAA